MFCPVGGAVVGNVIDHPVVNGLVVVLNTAGVTVVSKSPPVGAAVGAVAVGPK